MKNKIEKRVNILVPCKKCSQNFWPFYNFKETEELEKYCVSCKVLIQGQKIIREGRAYETN